MSIIRGDPIKDVATLLATKEMHYSPFHEEPPSFIQEECDKAFKKGEEKGEKLGYEKALAELVGLFSLMQTLTRKLLEQKKRLLDQLKPEIVDFSIAVCERVIRKELGQPETLARLISSLLTVRDPYLQREPLRILLAPEDLAMLEGHLDKIEYDKQELGDLISFRADPLIQRGDCRIEGQSALLNYSITRELSDLSAKVLQR